MQIFLATPEKQVFSGEAKDVLVNAEKGQINILENHANLITLVKPGEVRIRGRLCGRDRRGPGYFSPDIGYPRRGPWKETSYW